MTYKVSLFCLWISASLATLLHRTQTRTPDHDKSNRPSQYGVPNINATFDYVVVGGGTAGLALAARLAQNSSLSVAVVEAGGYYEETLGNISTTPGYAPYFAGTDPNDTNAIDWGFVTKPQAGADGRRMHYARGKTMGGSSARNFMIYHRPTIGSMDKWAVEVDDVSYSWSSFLQFLKKSVDYTPPSIPYRNSTNSQDDSAFTAGGSPLQVSFGKYEDPFGTWVQRALQAIGQVAIRGFQLGKLLGSAYVPFTEDPVTGFRSSSYSSFIINTFAPGRKSNLLIYNNTLAHRILFTGPNNVATGVLVSSSSGENVTYALRARKEVIVSAGAFQSPQLLMVSGIGPKEILERHNIPVLQSLQGVGQNLQDQVYFSTSYRVALLTASAALNNPALAAAAIEAFTKQAAGPLTNTGPPVFGWENFPNRTFSTFSPATQQALKTFPPDWPHLEFIPAGSILNNQNYALGDPVDGYNYASIATAVITPISKGNISISSPSMTDPPLINPAWLTSTVDQEVAIAAFRRQRTFWAYLVDNNITIGEEYRPGPEVRTDAQILRYIQRNVGPVWHAAATCKMGRKDDEMAVVDSQARVFGTRGLRVVDASAFPFLTPGHPQSVVYALAEKIAVDILGTGGSVAVEEVDDEEATMTTVGEGML